MKNIKILVREYKINEIKIHISLDDIINKVTQEVAELIKAHKNWNISEMYSEAGDVIVNIYSTLDELWWNVDFNLWWKKESKKNPINLTIMHWVWNQKVQAFRWRYSRSNVNLEDVEEISKSLVKEVLNYSNPDSNIWRIIQENTQKFTSRLDAYKPEIDIEDYIADYSDFPKPWILFKDISPIFKSPEAFRYVCMELAEKCKGSDVIVWLDSRGFLFWSLVAEHLNKPFVMVRKAWKLPWKTLSQDYGFEYWNDIVEIQEWAIEKWQKVSVIDDLLATGWTAKAAIDLIEKSGAKVDNVSFVISLDEEDLISMENRKYLENYNCNSVVSYS